MSRRHFPVSLVVALFLSTLALANSIPVTLTSLHSGASVHGGAFTDPGHFSINGAKATPIIFDAVNSRTSYRNAHLSGLPSGKVLLGNGTASRTGRIPFPGQGYQPTCCKAANWVGGDQGYGGKGGLSAPEPGSLILLSTGLLGIAGIVRRKLLRG
jgi:PEP-CTERM motif